MIELHVRKQIQPLFTRIAQHICIPLKLQPNAITAIAFISGIVAGLCVACNCSYMAICMLLISGLCDILDGTVARILAISNPLGAYIDLISDRMVEAAMIIGFAIAYPQYSFAYILFLVAVLFHFSTFLAAGALFKNDGPKSMHYDHSIIERAEAFGIFVLMLVFPEYIYPVLMVFSLAIACDGAARFMRVLSATE